MTREELREKAMNAVALSAYKNGNELELSAVDLDAAIALCMEEAARVADGLA